MNDHKAPKDAMHIKSWILAAESSEKLLRKGVTINLGKAVTGRSLTIQHRNGPYTRLTLTLIRKS